ncbi:hypothetical protein COP2_009986 [Malus domestica]
MEDGSSGVVLNTRSRMRRAGWSRSTTSFSKLFSCLIRLEACKSNGVQFMDGSMGLHHPRTAKLKDLVSDPKLFGQIDIAQFQYARIEVSVRTRLPPRI